MTESTPLTRDELAAALLDARRRTRGAIEDLDDDELRVPLLPILNPFLWELGHVAWFQERWTLRHLGGRPPLRRDADRLWDSAAVAHDTRWSLPLPARTQTLAYVDGVLAAVLERLAEVELTADELSFHHLVLFHEDMHAEAFVMMRQVVGLRAPAVRPRPGAAAAAGGGPLPGDVEIPGGVLLLGTPAEEPFAFDNERDAHEALVAPFRIARAPVTEAEFRDFVEDGGYGRDELWSPAGRAWRAETGATCPVYWRREGMSWSVRRHARWTPPREHAPMIHVNAHEAEAFCRWSGRRLPSESEWELAASALLPSSASSGKERLEKRRFPWGDGPASAARAHVSFSADGCVDVGALPAGDSPAGCRQMIGNVWEWTSSAFGPYPGFRAGAYREYSEPWFQGHRVLRGGSYATEARLLRASWRNFYTPERNDVLAGLRTAVDAAARAPSNARVRRRR